MQDRSTAAARTTPPWLWAWLIGYLLVTIPLQVSELRFTITTYFGLESAPVIGTSGFTAVGRVALIVSLLLYAVILAGAAASLFPRGRWVEWRFNLSSDARPFIAEMQRFVSSHDPTISLRVTSRSDQMARLYPVGWRSARIAVFRPLPALWSRDREAAEAILLREIAHRRQGDALTVGLGSPFVMVMRAWVPAYLLLVFVPNVIYFAAIRSSLAALSDIGYAAVVPGVVFLPVTALWLAELSADQVAVRAQGTDAVRRALRATAGSPASPASLAARALTLLSLPPRRLRLRLAAARPADTAALVAAWPVAFVLWLLFAFALAVLALLLIGLTASEMGPGLKIGARDLLAYSRPLAIATVILLLAWPILEHPWQRLWSAAPRPGHRQPWWPYLTAAILPLAVLSLSLLPLHSGLPMSTVPSGNCASFYSWLNGEGGKQTTEIDEFILDTADSTSITAATARQGDSEIQAALGNPPPGAAARSTYSKAMADLEAGIKNLQADGNGMAGLNAESKAASLLYDMISQCVPFSAIAHQ